MFSAENSGLFPGKAQAEQLKHFSEKGELTLEQVYSILVKKESSKVNISIPDKRIREYFPDTYTKEQVEKVIYALLEEWRQNGSRGTNE